MVARVQLQRWSLSSIAGAALLAALVGCSDDGAAPADGGPLPADGAAEMGRVDGQPADGPDLGQADASILSGWALGLGSSKQEIAGDVAVDSQGNVITAGYFEEQLVIAGVGTFTGGGKANANGSSLLLVKAAPDGAVLWATQVDGHSGGAQVAVDASDNIIVAGYIDESVTVNGTKLALQGYSDIFVAKYSPAGDVLWALSAGGNKMDVPAALTLDRDGDLLLTGTTQSDTLTFGDTTVPASPDGKGEIWLAKLSPAGELRWVRALGGTGWQGGMALVADEQKQIVLAGRFYQVGTLGGQTLTPRGDDDLFVARLSSDGSSVLWAVAGGGADKDTVHSLVLDASGNILVAGSFQQTLSLGGKTATSSGSSDGFVASLSPAGSIQWLTALGGTESDAVSAVAVDGQGDLWCVGFFGDQLQLGSTQLTSQGSTDVFLARLSAKGQPLWGASGGGPEFDGGEAIALDGQGNAVLTGVFNGSVTLGQTTLSAVGYWDWFVWTIALP